MLFIYIHVVANGPLSKLFNVDKNVTLKKTTTLFIVLWHACWTPCTKLIGSLFGFPTLLYLTWELNKLAAMLSRQL